MFQQWIGGALRPNASVVVRHTVEGVDDGALDVVEHRHVEALGAGGHDAFRDVVVHGVEARLVQHPDPHGGCDRFAGEQRQFVHGDRSAFGHDSSPIGVGCGARGGSHGVHVQHLAPTDGFAASALAQDEVIVGQQRNGTIQVQPHERGGARFDGLGTDHP